jgi:recombination protein RecA
MPAKRAKKPAKEQEEVVSDIDRLIAKINSKYGKGTILRCDEAPALIIDRISSGIFALDICLGGGWPRGRISMLKGGFSAGKTVVFLKTVSMAQRCDRYTGKPFEIVDSCGEVTPVDCGREGDPEPMRVVWIDAERSFDANWARAWGVDTNTLLVIQPEYGEQAVDIAEQCIRSGTCDLLVIDSVAALTPAAEIERSAEEPTVALNARIMALALRKWTAGMNSQGLLAETKCTILLVNQMRLDLSGFKPRLTSPGGKGLDHYCSIVAELKRKDKVIDPINGRPVGSLTECVVTKNRTFPLGSGGVFQLFYANSPSLQYVVGDTDYRDQVVRLASYWDLIRKQGSWFYIDGFEKPVQGVKEVALFILEQPEVLNKIADKIRECELTWLKTGEAPVAKKKEGDTP